MKENKILLLLGFILFTLVLSVIYLMMLIEIMSPDLLKDVQMFAPLMVFTGFFIFLIGACLVANVLAEYIKRKA